MNGKKETQQSKKKAKPKGNAKDIRFQQALSCRFLSYFALLFRPYKLKQVDDTISDNKVLKGLSLSKGYRSFSLS